MNAHYEALRTQATGPSAMTTTPRGLALFLRSGAAAWLTAVKPLMRPAATATVSYRWPSSSLPQHSELAVVLAEMVLNRRSRWAS